MKKLKRIILKVFKSIGVLVLMFIFLALISIIISKKDYNTPEENIGEKISFLAIKNAQIISMDEAREQIENNLAVLIDNGQIVGMISDSIEIPSKYKVVDASNKYIVPGLIDMHAHIFDRSDLPMYLGYGVTTVRNMMGFSMHLRWREQIKNKEYPGADLITASPTINSGDNTSPLHKNINSTEEAINAIKIYKEAGYDFIKIYDGLNTEQFDGILNEAKNNGLYVTGHPPHKVDLDHIINSDINSIEHIEEVVQGMMEYKLDTALGRSIAKKLKVHNTRITVTLSPFYAIYEATKVGNDFISKIPAEKINPFVRFLGKKQLSDWVNTNEGAYKWNIEKYECMEALVKIFDEEGVELLLGTDTGPNLTIPGITVHDEMKLLKKINISNYKILKSGTINAANALGKQSDIGSINVGKLANLLIVDNNPLDEIGALRNPYLINKSGITYNKEAIDMLRKVGEDKSDFFTSVGRFLNHLINI